ncbi:RNA polymerase sigma-24 factor [Gluconacetobacter sacchari DSM 12717]|uniref:Sigma-70 family RNA polymerase sigma factor n=2 Tax=Gluconacetobacter sacchari TaxID=92759 RepID=A0A7W4IAC2_9PROT|nr:sigma-70 family RNA polymerase sigma factor [Gluconacetobacter sacchari]MBB2159211.1 sigma-70 family RNA polymerase sigma factor [Gluconacetobacter sacchari]GBQ20773.1 RNA polymerase sigma-24 factor [Gluconacetobacter sacchari DSM 12717]
MREHSGDPSGGRQATPPDDRRLSWIVDEILPHEGAIRRWLRRFPLVGTSAEDIIQECYARLCAASPGDIRDGRSLFFHCARNLVIESARKANVHYLDRDLDWDAADIADAAPSPERIAAGRQEMDRLKAGMLKLPALCRDVFVLRKIYGLTYAQISQKLRISERSVERQIANGLARLACHAADDRQTDGALQPARRKDPLPPGSKRQAGDRQ